MERARVAVIAALFVGVSISGAVAAAVGPAASAPAPLAAVAWPPSTLLVSELQTGGTSASDEFAEITNVGESAVDLAGLEVVYATSTGGTVTRKASWSTTELLQPGRHLLIANTSGIFAAVADLTYSGGFAATGGAVAIRTIGGGTIDAIGWGDAANAFVEGTAAPAPAAGSSLERKPGGLSGNTVDTNSNDADWFSQASPNPQSLSAPPVPAPAPTPTPSASSTADPTAVPTPTSGASASPDPTVVPIASPTGPPDATSEPSSSPGPTLAPTPGPTLLISPTPEPTVTPTAAPTPVPTIAIATARALPDGSAATIAGVLTTRLAALEGGRTAFVQDATGGIALYLDAVPVTDLPAGTVIQARGTVDDRYAQRTLRVALADIMVVGTASVPDPLLMPAGGIDESVEGLRVGVSGITVGSPTAYADGTGILVDDGTGSIRVIVGPDALAGASVPSGTRVTATGPAGQHDSTGTGLGGYRIHATEAGELGVLPTPTPTPTIPPSPTPAATSAPTPGPSASPSATPSASPAPSATPSPSPTASPISIRAARQLAVGKVVTVAGRVTAEAGRLGTPAVIAIQDSTAGIAVRLPDGMAAPIRGMGVVVTGPISDPYGQLELRPATSGIVLTATGSLPSPADIVATDLGEGTEGLLVDLVGTASHSPTKGTSGDLSIDLVDPAGSAFRLYVDGSSGVVSSDLPIGRQLRITGIGGQRASRKGALDGYRVWARDRHDIVPLATSAPAPTGAPATSIRTVLAKPDGTSVTIEATVTAGTSLLDSSARRIVVQDGSAAIEVLLPVGTAGPGVGSVLRIAGVTAHAWGAPRLRATTVTDRHAAVPIAAAIRTAPPAAADEWRLVRISGTVTKVERFGDRWRVDVELSGPAHAHVPVLGQAGAGIPSTRLVVGATVTITGIVKRPYPTATDRRFAVLPRGEADLLSGNGSAGGSDAGTSDAGHGAPGGSSAGGAATSIDITPDTDLAVLEDRVGQQVRVGGLVTGLAADGLDLDDGTASAHLVLRGDALDLLPHMRVGDAIAATGRVERLDGAIVVAVAGAADLVRVGDLGQALPIDTGAGLTSPAASLPGAALVAAAPMVGGPESMSVLAMLGLSLVSLAATLVRRRQARRRIRVAIAARLATLKPIGGRA